MPLEGFTRRIRPLEILSDEQVEEIHHATLDVLETTGAVFLSSDALTVLRDGGCRVDEASGRVRIPAAVVEEAIRSAPSSYTVRSRDPSRSVRLGGNTLYFSDMPGKGILELATGRIRPATQQENRDAMIVLDALPHFHILCAYTPYFDVEGWAPLMSITESTAAKIRLSTKVQWTGYQRDCELYAIEMARATDQDIIGICCTASPLTFPSDACASALRFAAAGLPVHVVSGCMMGASAPVTVAGALVSFGAEALAGVVLTQLARRGARVSVEDSVLPMGMSSGGPQFGSLSAMQHTAAFAQVWRRYGLPLFADSGWTNAKRIDFQDGWERSLTAMVIALSGCHVANHHGGVFGELAFHPLQAVLDDDVAGIIGRFIEGVPVNRDTVALDLIQSVGPIPGDFLSSEHTLVHFRSQMASPRAADLTLYQEWELKGSKDTMDIARQRVEEILRTHAPLPLPTEQDREIERILEKARAHYAASA
jgi:trimethylamine---corrinoid protein Co-methyltransferase